MKCVTHTFIEKRVDDCIAVGSKEDGFASFSPIPFPSLQNDSNTLVQLLLLTTIVLFHPLCANQVIPLHSPFQDLSPSLHSHFIAGKGIGVCSPFPFSSFYSTIPNPHSQFQFRFHPSIHSLRREASVRKASNSRKTAVLQPHIHSLLQY